MVYTVCMYTVEMPLFQQLLFSCTNHTFLYSFSLALWHWYMYIEVYIEDGIEEDNM